MPERDDELVRGCSSAEHKLIEHRVPPLHMLLRMASILLSTSSALGLAMPKRIVWVCHGEVNSGLKKGAVYGGADVPLSSNGEAALSSASSRLRLRFTHVEKFCDMPPCTHSWYSWIVWW